jgi:hypothetical protein
MRTLIISLVVFCVGFGVGVWVEATYNPKADISTVDPLSEQILLQIPKNDKEMERQLLYLSASMGMLEELHRQSILRRK